LAVLYIREFVVRKHERGLLFRNGDFERFLAPSVYRFFDPRKRLEVERFDLTQPSFEHRLLDYFVRWHPETVEDLFLRVETGAGQVAVVYRNGHPWTYVAPERRALFWKGVVHVKAEVLDTTKELAVPQRIAQALLTDTLAGRKSAFEGAVFAREVPEAHVGLLFVDGRLVRELAPGPHAFWRVGRSIAVELVDLRVKALDVGEQELLTKDKASLRIQMNASYRFRDAQLTVRSVRDPVGFLYREIQLGLRNAVAKRSLDALLEHKGSLDRDVFVRVHDKLAALGIDLTEIGVNELARIAL
jgi:regulator of protease activity HflC (stomatin/prohibitin superfamily)